MKKIFLIVLFLIYWFYSFSQQTFFQIAENYFRSNPFKTEFSTFLTHLMNDPAITNKTIDKKTDSTLFFFEGTYNSYNPFFFKAIRTKVILAEKEEPGDDTSQLVYTNYYYQLIGYAVTGDEGVTDIHEEFDKFCKRYKKKFDEEDYKEIKNQEKLIGEIRKYSLKYPGYFPLMVAWATSREKNDNIFALTVKFRVYNNIAYLPMSEE
ncbi:MAG: hypothetical protein ABUT20_18515 [Bacteroidota bacterium]